MSTEQVLSLIDVLGEPSGGVSAPPGGFYGGAAAAPYVMSRGMSRVASAATLAALEQPGSLEEALTAFSAHEQRMGNGSTSGAAPTQMPGAAGRHASSLSLASLDDLAPGLG